MWQNGAVTGLGSLVVASGINNSGQIVGGVVVSRNVVHPAIWQDGVITDLGTIPFFDRRALPHVFGAAINEEGDIVGFAEGGQGFDNVAFLWSDGVMTPLLGSQYPHSGATALNDDGEVVGWVGRLGHPQRTRHAALWDLDGQLTDLTPNAEEASAFDINDSGEVVGFISTRSRSSAFLWEEGTLTDLNRLIPADLGWILNYARAINACGEIVGSGSLNGVPHGFKLQPIDENTAGHDERPHKQRKHRREKCGNDR
jgi:probable HAF family extracellular repeat protein